MNQAATPQQLLHKVHQHLDELDNEIAREALSSEERKVLRSIRGIIEKIELSWRNDIHATSISIATRNHINSLLNQSRFLSARKLDGEIFSFENLCIQLMGPRKFHPILSKVRVTKREEEVLSAISRGLTGEEIASELHISLATVKSHLTSLYRKLDVTNRTSAVRRARELTIIT